MEHSGNSRTSVTEFQKLWGRWTNLMNRFYGDPKVELMMDTRIGQYMSSHPLLALTVLLFGVMAALPVGLFLSFAFITIVMTTVGFVFFEVFLLCVGGLTLLSLLPGIAIFSVMVSLVFNAFYVTISKVVSRYYKRLTKEGKVLEDQGESVESECDTSKLEDIQ
ncbi:promethin [Anarrhichthys ocellatus]|uniref:promethin n=1 Tax=Anarrhichthys ocellatus TaxID=433405 RepID=UPI0012EDA8DE|nr:promethin [Anarrhichthys ocellatus]XP_031728174.1 promethin [Anarrhichthys ocellatus]